VDPKVRIALDLIVRDRNTAQAQADNPSEHPAVRADRRGQVHGYNMALASFAGALGFGWRADLELDLVANQPRPIAPVPEPGPDDPTDEDEPAFPELDRNQAIGHEPATYSVTTSAAIRPVAADPMGGWEPRT
jgi:hypothetical protein